MNKEQLNTVTLNIVKGVLPMKKIPLESVVTALRCAAARELVERFGYRKSEVAKIVGVTPAAVSQYVSGKRGGKLIATLSSSTRPRAVVVELAGTLSDGFRRGNAATEPHLLAAAGKIITLVSGEAVHDRAAPRADRKRVVLRLRKRLEEEHHAARQSMAFAQKSRDELVKSLFRQIAADSMKHADIVSLLMAHLDKPEPLLSLKPLEIKNIEEMMKHEEEAGDADIESLKPYVGDAAKLLIDSIEADEKKHLILLKGFMKLAKRGA